MIITDDYRKIIEGTTFPTLITLKEDGTPYPIVTGAATIQEDQLLFGIGAMVHTQANLKVNNSAILVFVDGQPKGIRVYGTAKAENGKIVFTANQIDALN